MKSALAYGSALVGTFLVIYFLLTGSSYTLIGVAVAVFIGVLFRARDSAYRLGALAVILLIGIPLVPGLQETRQPQLFVFIAVSLGLLVALLRLARRRRRSIQLPVWTLCIVASLTLLTTVLADPDQFRMLLGFAWASVLALGLALSAAADEDEKRRLLAVLTVIAVIASLIAFVEAIRKAPVYEFTAFQVNTNPLVAFRASSIFGHPLVLCAYLSFVALANTVRPAWAKVRWFNGRVVTIGIPLAGAAVSGSRSIALFAAVGIVAILIMRQDKHLRKGVVLSLAVLSIALGYFALSTDSVLAERFGSLTTGEQSIRLGGWAVVEYITQGLEIFIGGGPRSVAQAYLTADSTFGTVDNQLLTAYADLGVVGVSLVLLLVVRVATGIRRRGAGTWTMPLIVASTTTVASFFVMDSLAWPILSLLFGLGAGASTKAKAPADDLDQRIPVQVGDVPAVVTT